RGGLFTADSYNEYLQKMVRFVTDQGMTGGGRGRARKDFPLMQVNQGMVAGVLDTYVRTKLFGREFDPMHGNNWRVLMLTEQKVFDHVRGELNKVVLAMLDNVGEHEAVVEKRWFSEEVPSLSGRGNHALDIVKSIYEKTFFPSNKGGLEKDFMLAADADSNVERIMKIDEKRHGFAHLKYVRPDGMIASYYPDFMLKAGDCIYLVETKGADREFTPEVRAKKIAAVDWVGKINALDPGHRMGCRWVYVLLTDAEFYPSHEKGAEIKEILDHCELTKGRAEGNLL
ncbi:MAG: restriction endonuclease subunit R, partial [Kiritimatiellaeota bacterium]|nr:restriction endonuclease subunit R [Kiritimatiellota bacterium]